MNGAVVVTIVACLVTVALLLLAAQRSDGAARRSVVPTVLAYIAWTAGCVSVLFDIPDVLFWAVIRPMTLVFLVLAAISSPGVIRSRRAWLGLLLDGWIMVGGAFGVAWLVALAQTVFPERAGVNPQMLWLIAQVGTMCAIGGLFARSVPSRRPSALIALLVGLTVLAGDVLALVTGEPKLGLPFWLGSGLLGAIAMVITGGQLFAQSEDDGATPHRIPLWQLPVPFLLASVFLPMQLDIVTKLTTLLVVAGLFSQLIRHSRGNERFWARLVDRTRVFEAMLLDSQDVIIQINDLGVVEFANPAVARVLSWDPAALIGTALMDLVHPEDRSAALHAIHSSDWARRLSIRLEVRFAVPASAGGDGDFDQWRHIEWTISHRGAGSDGRVSGWLLSGRDVSERIALERELVQAARTDALTGLLNRATFLRLLDDRLGTGAAAVLFLDLDEFKAVNDTLGHGQGDQFLRQAGECLGQAVGPHDLVARLGGDEFAVLLGCTQLAEVTRIAEAVLTAFNGFDETAAGRRSVSASIGVAIAERGTAIDLLRDADLAMYRAKQNGGAGVVEFEPWMSERVMEKARLRANLEIAVRNESLVLYMQPVVDLHTEQWTGFEALIRWPVGAETWSPAQFLPVAEESGLIVPIGAWVLGEALRQLAGWRENSLAMAVNVAAQQLVGTDLYGITMAALAASGVSPDRLTLEITEQAAIQDLGRTASRLEALRAEGVHIAIDDFGTGFSSLQYLSRLPVDILKIDRKFVWGLGQHAEDDVLVRSMLGLAAELGLEVIAEGVETIRQAELLREYGCRLAQGFLFSLPRPIEELRSSDPFVSPPPIVPRPRATSDRVQKVS
jgi:diguanylate cyclase (GGDEF)-like protein/PAS domain S-box-containing protein